MGSGTFFIHEVHRLNALFVLDRFILYVQQVCEVDSAAVAEKLASSSADISALDAEHASSWSPASGCSDTAEDSVLQQATQAKVEAVTLMLTVQPGNHVTTSTCSYIACSFVLGPVWARGRCRISPPRFLAECCKRQLNQVSLFLLYFRLSAFSDLY